MLNRISKLISAKDLSFASVERQLGFGNGSIKRWDKSMPSIDKVALLANFLNVSIDYLFTGKEPTITDSSASALPTILSDDETNLIELYRELPNEDKREFIGELRGYIKHMSKTPADP